MPYFFRTCIFCVLLFGGVRSTAAQGSMGAFVHDPVMIKQGSTYYVYYTGNLTPYKTSDNRYSGWRDRGATFSSSPSWVASTVPGNNGRDFWAPDISFRDDTYWLYFSVSTFGSNTSAIGLATSPTLDPSAADYRWTDRGVVIKSSGSNNYNCIDPNVFEDTDGKVWLTFGSFWTGIKMVELDAATGKPLLNAELRSIASRPSTQIEAPFLTRWNNFYYLFVSWDKCCSGASSTYKIVVGRSEEVTGPFVDKTGKVMTSGGGTIIDSSTAQWKGPGHNGIFIENDTMFCINHAYAASNGAATMFIRPLYWKDEWPQFAYVPPTELANAGKTRIVSETLRPRILLLGRTANPRLIATDGKEYYSISGAKLRNPVK
jgi:arabinan endo-1,5-alpha-L-arabinosidase